MGNKGRTRTDFSALARLAKRQHGVVATHQLARLGISRFVIADAARHGRAHRLHRGVYAVGHTDLSWSGRLMAAVLASAPAVASHWSAAWLWGVARYRPESFELIVPSRRGHRRRELFVHYAPLAEEDVAEVDGIPTTAFERTHLDLAARWPQSVPKLLEPAEKVEDEEGRRRLDLRRFESLLERTPRHPGHKPPSQSLRIYRPDPARTSSSAVTSSTATGRASASVSNSTSTPPTARAGPSRPTANARTTSSSRESR
jgi:predicted transcriptional regulator of viral defense system